MSILPQIYKKRNMDVNFTQHFKRRQLSVVESGQKYVQAKRSFAQSSPRENGAVKARQLGVASQMDDIGRSSGRISKNRKGSRMMTDVKHLQRNETEMVPLQNHQSLGYMLGVD
jgi:hypothetical protein